LVLATEFGDGDHGSSRPGPGHDPYHITLWFVPILLVHVQIHYLGHPIGGLLSESLGLLPFLFLRLGPFLFGSV
jgi:hypothetical protein